MNEYLKNLRKLVGHMPILVCGASVIVENEDGEILLQLRKDNKCWGYPGGSVDTNEVVEEAAKRELLEETGIEAISLELFGVFSEKNCIMFILMAMKYQMLILFLSVKTTAERQRLILLKVLMCNSFPLTIFQIIYRHHVFLR